MLARLRPRLTYANVVSTLCLFIVLGGGALAAVSFVQANGTIRGCVSKKGQLTVLKKGKKKCRKGQRALSWNQTGRAGAPGQNGSTGPPGPATGPAGGDLTGNYPDPAIKPNVVSGANIDESTLGQVPSAATAANASQLGGLAPSAYFRSSNVARFHSVLIQATDGTSTADALDFSGLTLLIDCQRDSGLNLQTIRFRVSTGGANPALTSSFVNNAGNAGAGDFFVSTTPAGVFDRAVSGPLGAEIGTGMIVYRDDAQVISIPFRYTVGWSSQSCTASGMATRAG